MTSVYIIRPFSFSVSFNKVLFISYLYCIVNYSLIYTGALNYYNFLFFWYQCKYMILGKYLSFRKQRKVFTARSVTYFLYFLTDHDLLITLMTAVLWYINTLSKYHSCYIHSELKIKKNVRIAPVKHDETRFLFLTFI